jgi:circadian clock protein KaiC
LITGTSGTGKTTFACSFRISAIAEGERLLYLDFEESWSALVSCMNSAGLDLEPAQESERLYFLSSMPESQGVEEHLIQAFRAIESFHPDHLVLDAISACRRMGSSQAAFDYLLRLVNHCKERGITTVLTNLTAASDADREITGIDLSSVIDTVILLRNQETDEGFVRKLAILKSRGQPHSCRAHVFRITDRGIEIHEESTDEN